MKSRQIQRIVNIAEKMNLLKDKGVRNLITSLSIDWDKDLAEDLEQALIHKSLPRLIDDPFYPYPKLHGEILVGLTPSSHFGLTKQQINQNMLVVGRSGSGKTNLFYNIMEQFIENKIPWLAIDFKKDYRHLAKNHDVIVISHEKLKYNPLQPPANVSRERWMQIFADVFCHANALLSGSKNFLLENLQNLYKMYGDNYPSFHDLKDILNQPRKMNSKITWYLETVKNRVNSTLISIGDMLDCEEGYPIEELLKRNVVLELDGVAEDVQNYIVESLLSWIYHYRLAKGHRGKLRHGIFFDEAKRIFDVNKERQPASGIPIIDIICDRAREFGEALIVADQEPSKLTDSIKANTFSKIMLSLGSGKDIEIMSRCMGLNQEQANYVHKLTTGQGIVKLAGETPFAITTPFFEIQKDMRDDQLPCLDFSFKPRVFVEKFKEKQETFISKDAEQLLIDINDNLATPVTKRYEKLDVSAYRENKAKQLLLSNNFISEREISIGKGGRPVIFEITDLGGEYLKSKGHTFKKYVRGPEHRYWQHRIKQYFESWGCKVYEEWRVGKKSIDIVVLCPNNRTMAIEVAMSPEHQIENIKKCLELKFHEVIIACKSKKVLDTIKTKAGTSLQKQVQFCLVRDIATIKPE